MIIQKQLNEINEQDLQSLIAAAVREGKTIKYKERIAIERHDQKRKFVASVTCSNSFLTATG